LPAFPDLLWDLKDMGKLSEDIDTVVNLYEYARHKPGVSTKSIFVFDIMSVHRISVNNIYGNLLICFPLSGEGLQLIVIWRKCSLFGLDFHQKVIHRKGCRHLCRATALMGPINSRES